MSRRGTTESMLPSGARAVMASRREPPDSLDLFPTPPWSTRALLDHLFGKANISGQSVWDPCAGRGHMSDVLAERFGTVLASDVFDYGLGHQIGSFIGFGPDVAECAAAPDWLIFNPPFNQAEEFVIRALREARFGVAALVRTAWLESQGRYEALFRDKPPSQVALFVERVPMVKGRWDPDASTATSYAWVIWTKPYLRGAGGTEMTWIPPGRKEELTRGDDRRRFAPELFPEKDLFSTEVAAE